MLAAGRGIDNGGKARNILFVEVHQHSIPSPTLGPRRDLVA